jgi:hypothetical protein
MTTTSITRAASEVKVASLTIVPFDTIAKTSPTKPSICMRISAVVARIFQPRLIIPLSFLILSIIAIGLAAFVAPSLLFLLVPAIIMLGLMLRYQPWNLIKSNK